MFPVIFGYSNLLEVVLPENVEVQHADKKGRFLVAKRSFTQGELIFSEKAVAWFPLKLPADFERCFFCLNTQRLKEMEDQENSEKGSLSWITCSCGNFRVCVSV